MSTSSRVRIVPVVLGLLLIPVFVVRIGLDAIVAELQRLGPETLLILAPYALGTALSAFPWAWMLDEDIRPRASGTVASRFAASGANALLPLFGFAGEPCRLLWLRADCRAVGLAAIVVDRLLYNSAGGLLLIAAAVAALGTRLGVARSASAALLGLVILGSSFVVIYAISHWGIGRRVHGILRRFLGSSYAEPELGTRVDVSLRALLKTPGRVMLQNLGVHFLARVVQGVEVYVALWALRAPTSVADAIVLAAVPIATSVFASSIPSQIGVQEGAQSLVCAALGHSPALGLVLVLLLRLRQLAFVPLTPLLIAAARPHSRGKAEASAH
jgi:lysylphosphatidylglycerol synthase-like protein